MQKMEHSDIASSLPKTVLKGKHNNYQINKQLGRGGNGTVFDVSLVEPNSELPAVLDGYAIKKLKCKKHSKKEERFKIEIHTVLKLQDEIPCIIPIYDYSLGGGKNRTLWYLMPRAKEYDYWNYTAIDNLKLLKSLGNTIARLHNLGHAHRDIKPDNTLFYGKELYLSDFGLVWDCFDNQKLTSIGEGIGPKNIRPPELEQYSERIDNFDFRVSDVYLFAKTMWIILTKKKNCFRGEYHIGDPISSLNCFSIDLGDTLGPLHELMENATLNDFEKRYPIDKCLELMDKQISICNGSMSETEKNKYKFEERIAIAKAKNIPDDVTFRDDLKILDFCKQLQGAAELIINNGAKCISLGQVLQVQYQTNSIFIISVKGIRPKRDIYVSIDSIITGEDKSCTCQLKRFVSLPNGIKAVTGISEIEFLPERKFALDVDLKMMFVQL